PAWLPRDAPVGTVFHHSADAVLAPRRDPSSGGGDLVDGLERGLADGRLPSAGQLHLGIERDPPLIRRPEDHRLLAAPAVRVAVLDLECLPAPVEERPRLAQAFHDLRIGVEYLLAFQAR